MYAIDKGNANSKIIFESSANKFFCAIYGPLNKLGMQTYECDIAVTINHQTEQAKNSIEKEKQLVSQIKQLLEINVIKNQYQKQSIEVVFDIIDYSGSIQQHLLNALAIALPLAGIQIYDSFSSISISLFNNEIIVDQTQEEIENSQAILDLSLAKQSKKLLLLNISGNVKIDKINQLLSFGLECASNMLNYLADILKKELVKNN